MSQRLSLALDGGGLVLPEGRILLVGPPSDYDVSGMPRDRTCVVHRQRVEHDHFASMGFEVATEMAEPAGAVIICAQRAKAMTHALIAGASQICTGPLVIDGLKADGVDSLLKSVRARVPVQGPINKAHGKLFWMNDGFAGLFDDWADGPALTDGGFWTAPGVFSADGVDPASVMLADALPKKLGKTVADLGAGWGMLSAHILTRDVVELVHLVEADHLALECAKRNVTDPRARFHWADATTWSPEGKVDTVVMNPPFHTGRTADPALGRRFIRAAAGMLTPSGHLWMVANRHLAYETTLAECFRHVEEITGSTKFKVLLAQRPARTKR